MRDDGHPRKNAVFRLGKVVCLGITVDIRMNFVDPWQWMQNFYRRFCIGKHFIFKNIDIFYLFIFDWIYEAFLLNTGHIDDICLVDDLIEFKMFKIPDPPLGKINFVFIRHG